MREFALNHIKLISDEFILSHSQPGPSWPQENLDEHPVSNHSPNREKRVGCD